MFVNVDKSLEMNYPKLKIGTTSIKSSKNEASSRSEVGIFLCFYTSVSLKLFFFPQ